MIRDPWGRGSNILTRLFHGYLVQFVDNVDYRGVASNFAYRGSLDMATS